MLNEIANVYLIWISIMLNEIANVYLIWIRIFLGDPRCMFGALQMLLFGEYLIRFGLVHNLEKVLERYRL